MIKYLPLLFVLTGCDQSDSDHVNVLITWSDMSGNEQEFLVERRFESDVYFDTVYFEPMDTEEFIDNDVQTGETYCYRVGASNLAGVNYSDTVCVSL